MSNIIEVTFWCGDEEKKINILEELDISLAEWEKWSDVEKDKSVDALHDNWLWAGRTGWHYS